MITLHNKIESPPGGWRFLQQETGKLITAPNWTELLSAVKKHRRANEIPIGLNFEQEIEEWICSQLPPEFCAYKDAQIVQAAAARKPVSLDMFREGSRTLLAWWKSGFELAPQEQANAHASVCVQRPFNQPVSGCTPCTLKDVLGWFTGFLRKTPHDANLKACSLCGCGLKIKVHFTPEVIRKASQAEYPPNCWIKEKKE